MTVVIVLLICGILPIIVGIKLAIDCNEDEYQTINDSYPKITFQLFTEMYSIRPDKWELKNDYVYYLDDCEDYIPVFPLGKWTKIAFKTGKDHRKYRKFYTRREEQKRILDTLSAEKDLAKQFQEDVNKYRSEVIEEMKAHMPKEDQ